MKLSRELLRRLIVEELSGSMMTQPPVEDGATPEWYVELVDAVDTLQSNIRTLEGRINDLNTKIVTVTKGWTDAYYNIFMAGEADIVLSYTTSPAAHIMFENNNDFSAINFEEGNYISIEFSGILKSSKNKSLAKKFLKFILTEDFQSVIPSTNIMYPVIKLNNLPEAYKNLQIPKALQISPEEISANKEKWIEEWLNAS